VKVGEAIAEILGREGVDTLIGYPVSPLIEPAAAIGIRPIIVRQERTGIHIADSMSRTTSGRRIGVFTMQSGPGTENAVGGVAQAFADSVPILVIAAGHDRREMTMPPNFSAFQNYRSITKWIDHLVLPETVVPTMRRAFARLRNGRPRPVLVEVPWDVWTEDCPDPTGYVPPVAARSAPDPTALDRAAEVLVAAERPVIYAGQGVHYAEAWPELRALAELLGAPVTTSLQGKSAFPEDHPLSLGSGGRTVPRPVDVFMGEADVVLGIGCSFTKTGYGLQWPEAKRYVHATLDPADLDQVVPVEVGLVGDARLVLAGLVEAVGDRIREPRRERAATVAARIARIRSEWLADWHPKLHSETVPMTPYRVITDLAASVDVAHTIVTHDAGSPRDQVSPFWPATTPLSYIGWGKSTQLGYGLGLAIGAKLAHPDRLCINIMGDAAFGMTGLDFETAVRERIPILTVVLNNFSMAIELPEMPISTERYRSTDIGGAYAAIARDLGGWGERVTEPSDIGPAVRRAVAATEAGQAALLEFITSKELAISMPGSTLP
jgi:acetolactate synthase-1/2/3 large subunit